jgi:hypothetical protein
MTAKSSTPLVVNVVGTWNLERVSIAAKVGVLRDSHYLFLGNLNDFLARKRKKNCASRFKAKKSAREGEGLSVASRLVARLVAPQLYLAFSGNKW